MINDKRHQIALHPREKHDRRVEHVTISYTLERLRLSVTLLQIDQCFLDSSQPHGSASLRR